MAVESRDKTLDPFVYLLMKSIVSNRLYVGLVHLISHMGLAGDVGLTDLVGLTNRDARCVLLSSSLIWSGLTAWWFSHSRSEIICAAQQTLVCLLPAGVAKCVASCS